MTIKIYGHPHSSAGRTYWTLEEVNQPYERVPLSMKDGEHRSEEFLKINPNGKVPALIDGDYTIWDSSAIDHYLAKKYKPELLGETPEEEGQVMQWCFWSLTEVQPPLIAAFIQKVFVPEERRKQDLIEESIEKSKKYLKILDDSLKGREYLATDKFTLADISAGSVINILSALEFPLSPYPEINRWMINLSKREAFKRVAEIK